MKLVTSISNEKHKPGGFVNFVNLRGNRGHQKIVMFANDLE